MQRRFIPIYAADADRTVEQPIVLADVYDGKRKDKAEALLGVHRVWERGERSTQGPWQVTHVPTGYGCGSYAYKRTALAVAKSICRWSSQAGPALWSTDPKRAVKGFPKQISRYLRSIHFASVSDPVPDLSEWLQANPS